MDPTKFPFELEALEEGSTIMLEEAAVLLFNMELLLL